MNCTHYYHGDHLGSTRAVTYNGTYAATDFQPFGEITSGGAGTTRLFTGFERDAESALDHTWFRQYSSAQARWLSPDPLGGSIGDPQSLNRYAYVLNNPLRYVDPLGLSCVFYANVEDTIGTVDPEVNDFWTCMEWGGEWYDDTPGVVVTSGGGGGIDPNWNPGGSCVPVSAGGFGGSSCDFPASGVTLGGPIGGNGGGDGSEGGDGTLAWLSNFGTSFAENVQKSCVFQFVGDTAVDMITPGLSNVGEAAGVYYGATQHNAALNYAATTASRTFGTPYLVYPNRSSVVRGLLASARSAPVVGALISLNISMIGSLRKEYEKAQSGQCH